MRSAGRRWSSSRTRLAQGCFLFAWRGGCTSRTLVAPSRVLLELVDAVDPPPAVFLLDLSAVTDADVSSLRLLADFRDSLEQREIELWLAGILERPRAMLLRSDDLCR